MLLKKILKRILIAVLAFVLVLSGIAVFAYTRYLHPTGEIMPGLYAVRNDRDGIPMVNFFIMQADDGNYIAIDAGSDNGQTANALERLGISADDIAAVFLTQTSFDHVTGIHLFNNAILHSWDTDFRYVGASPFSPFTGSGFYPPDIPHYTMTDGEIIELYGRTIQAIYTPGDATDSMAFLVDGRYLFVGNLFLALNGAQQCAELQVLSRENVLGIDSVEYVFTGHFGLFRNVRFFRWRW